MSLSLGRLDPKVMSKERFNADKKAVIERIDLLEEAIGRAREYLESGQHAHWRGFRPLFDSKFRNGEELPPHKDWVKNVLLAGKQKALRDAEELLERLDR